jgi:hypothetical protein
VAAQNQVIVNLTANAKGFVAGTSQAQKALQNFNQGIIASTQGVTKFFVAQMGNSLAPLAQPSR